MEQRLPKGVENEKAVEFWDNYYVDQLNEQQRLGETALGSESRPCHSSDAESIQSKEWILRDSPFLMNFIRSKLKSIPTLVESAQDAVHREDNKIRTRRVLEIGCGTSRLSRSLLEYLQSTDSVSNKEDNKDTTRCIDRYDITATDVSEVCLRISRERDKNFPPLLNHRQSQYDDDQRTPPPTPPKSTTGNTLTYQMFDVTKYNDDCDESTTTDHTNTTNNSLPRNQDMVLDKGCLDTLLFRRSTWNQNTASCSHSPLVTNLLNNVHSLLRPNGGTYLLITPRSKLKPVRDFKGFRSVDIQKVDDRACCAGDGDGAMDGGVELGDLQRSGGERRDSMKKSQNQCVYMYTCVRDDGYRTGECSPYVDHYGVTVVPRDDDVCLRCSISFLEFRMGEDLRGRGQKYWTRRWRGHGQHCTG